MKNLGRHPSQDQSSGANTFWKIQKTKNGWLWVGVFFFFAFKLNTLIFAFQAEGQSNASFLRFSFANGA